MITAESLSDVFVEVADSLVDDFDLVEFLHRLTDHAAVVSGADAVVSGADAVGIVLADHHGRLRFMAASNASGEAMELLQLQDEEGPCRDCLEQGTPVVHTDLADGTSPWPSFAPRAVGAGVRSVHAFPMRLRHRTIGALNLFSRTASDVDVVQTRVVQALADVATIAILQERSLTRAEVLTEQLQGALHSRVAIEQAKGVLAQSMGIGVDEAFGVLRERARGSRRRIADLAAEIVRGT